jgi:hypothetical protein
LGKGYDDFGLIHPAGQNLGGFNEFKGGGHFPGGEDYPVPLCPADYALLLFQCYFVY